ncbi:hypothetical protein ACFZB9_15800 [Kitasatospora sp. NPDC008050]|uniref:hypothetical protein n=1 Tax=Kitasatospora sp. NPDC008050 TaxID=3364021 RepID=UPI0036E24990
MAGCSGAPAPTPPATATPTHPTTARPTPGPPLVVLGEQANGGSVTVPTGATVRLLLHSTFWAAPRSSAPGSLAPLGAPDSAPSSGPGCRPGSGCGTVTADFLARAAATVRLTTTRTSCGEALRCRPGQADFTVTVVISPVPSIPPTSPASPASPASPPVPAP